MRTFTENTLCSTPFNVRAIICALAIVGMTSPVSAQETAVWPGFRGPDANPISENENLPDHWSTTDNVEWSIDIPGRGWSSPIVVGDKVIVTTVVTDGESKLPQVGTDYSNDYVAELMAEGLSEEEVEKKVMERDFELPDEVSLHYFVYCVDINTGEELWKDEFFTGQPPGGRHRKNSFTSETPVTDGQFVYVYVTNLGLFAYDLHGTQVWKKELENFPIYLEFGTGSSPVLVDDRIIILNDNQEQAFIAAYNKSNGEEIWRTERAPIIPEGMPADAAPKSGWMTPFVWRNSERTEIITLGPGVATSYDTDGKELWRLTGTSIAPSASSFAYEDLLYLNGGKMKSYYAILPGAEGDITLPEGELSSEFVVWSMPRTGTYIPTPVAYDGGLYILQDNGIVIRLDAETGEESFKERLKSSGADFTTSPWAYNGKVFCLSEQGDTYVLQAGEEYNLLHVNALGDLAMSSPAIVGDRLLVRTEKTMYSFRKAEK